MPAIFHNSTAADSSTNTAARPASASPLRPPPRAPSAWPRPRGPRLPRRPSSVHLSPDSLRVLCLSSPRTGPLSPAVCLSFPPQALSLSVLFLGPPPPSVRQSSQHPVFVRLSDSHPSPTPALSLAGGLSVCLSVCPPSHPLPASFRHLPGGGGGEGWGRGVDAVCSPSSRRRDSPGSGYPTAPQHPGPCLA